MKGVVAQTEQLCENTVKYTVSDECFVTKCEKGFGRRIVNLSRFGSTVLAGFNYLERHFKEINKNDVVVLEFGGNDCNFDWKAIAERPHDTHNPFMTIKQFHETYVLIIEKLLNIGAFPVLLSLPPIQSQRFFDYVSRGLDKENIMLWLCGDVNNMGNWHEQYNLEVFKIGAQMGVPVIDISSVFMENRHLNDFYCQDGMHPNEAGHALIAEAILGYRDRFHARFGNATP